ncbi:hypothetical protein [Baekduia sp.]|uniref:hypothetical protein n=1 Tax=Baekduia sp. TaxID=2600305 RepID=UPI002D1FAB6F|nr:hypothetical protein [Baekduia sp.]
MTAAFWWLYFDVHARRTLERLRTAGDERGRLGRDLSYLYVLLMEAAEERRLQRADAVEEAPVGSLPAPSS